MKVLDMVHGLEVKDIRSFVDWLKTFHVELDGGGKWKYYTVYEIKAAYQNFASRKIMKSKTIFPRSSLYFTSVLKVIFITNIQGPSE